jgi:hypothetical protein
MELGQELSDRHVMFILMLKDFCKIILRLETIYLEYIYAITGVSGEQGLRGVEMSDRDMVRSMSVRKA